MDDDHTTLEAQLLAAVERGDVQGVVALIRAGADVGATDPRGRTAVTVAAFSGHAEVVHELIDAGADVDRQDDERYNAVLACGVTGDVEVLRSVLRGRPDLTLRNRYGGIAIIPAAERGHVDLVRELLATTAIDVDHVNDLGWTALLEAVILSDGGPAHVEIVRLLLDAGADRTIADRDGVTALEHARRRGFAEMVTLLEAPGAVAS
ncbi:MAG TPA: ankyrin repeat domain-containing protein [Baekduia sp.]